MLSASVRATLAQAVSGREPARLEDAESRAWVRAMHGRVMERMRDERHALEFLELVRYEAQRAGLDPQLVLAVIDVESDFRKYAVSTAGARGYMQVMPFWVREIGMPGQNLFHPRTNLRYGCVILRHYLEIERGNLHNALARYNGSLGRPEYPAPRAARPARAAGPRAPSLSASAAARSPPRAILRVTVPVRSQARRPVGVEDHGRGQPLRAAELLLRAFVLQHQRIGVAELPRELLRALHVVDVERDAQHDRARRRVGAAEFRDLRDLLDAGRAPGRPEVHHHPLAAIVREAVALAVGVGDVEGERRLRSRGPARRR